MRRCDYTPVAKLPSPREIGHEEFNELIPFLGGYINEFSGRKYNPSFLENSSFKAGVLTAESFSHIKYWM